MVILQRLTTALHPDDYRRFRAIVDRERVCMSAYLRAMIRDVIAEELPPSSGDEQRTTTQ